MECLFSENYQNETANLVAYRVGIESPANDPNLESVDLSDDEGAVEAIEAFLLTLSDSDFDQTIPISVPSGLIPGGGI